MADIGLVLRKQQSKLGEALTKKTHFSVMEIENLLNLYRKLSVGIDIDRLDRTRFREFLHNAFDMTDDILLDRIFKFFDDDNDGFISREEWILGLSVFMKGNEEELIKYCFDIYDLNGDGMISREEMLNMLKTSLGRQGMDEDPDEGVKDLIDMTLRKLDKDKDGKVSFKDWSTTVRQEPLMMEAFGPCLPSKRQGALFMQKVESDYMN
eukprot:01723.XXX_1663_2342_1 [CDS] Oithona nana genome sequencing.